MQDYWCGTPSENHIHCSYSSLCQGICKMCIICIYQPVCMRRMWQGQFFSGVQLCWIQSFPSPRLFTILRLKSQSALLFTHSWRIVRCILCLRVIGLCEMKTASFRVWTQVTGSISYNDSLYMTNILVFIISHKIQ